MDKFLELKVIITFSIFVFFLIIERLLVYKEYFYSSGFVVFIARYSVGGSFRGCDAFVAVYLKAIQNHKPSEETRFAVVLHCLGF